MQIAASPTVDFVKTEDISEEVREAERQAEMKSEDLAGKPDDIKAKMVEGRLGKILKRKVRKGGWGGKFGTLYLFFFLKS